jgi:hypothetical protein
MTLFALYAIALSSPTEWTRAGWWGWRSRGEVGSYTAGSDQPSPADATVVYAAKFNIDDAAYLIELRNESSATTAARAFANTIGAEPIKHRWIETVLRHGYDRIRRALVWADTVSIEYPGRVPAVITHTIEVREGDDLGQLATWYGYKYGLDDAATTSLYAWIASRTPQHATPSWVEARDVARPAALAAAGALRPSSRSECSVTVALTSCRRLELFRQTARALRYVLQNPAVCRVIVVDDGSPLEERAAMLEEFAEFEYVMKPAHADRAGHADSMNIIAAMAQTRYLFYVEDDWRFLADERDAATALDDALAVLRSSSAVGGTPGGSAAAGEAVGDAARGRPLAQVLLNDQSTRKCAQGFVEACPAGVLGSGGWHRSHVDRATGRKVEYRAHEFGLVLLPPHGFSYWPGFSLNPGVWDLERMRAAGALPRAAPFNSSDVRFEQSFSMRVADSGLRVAFLPRLVMRHLGVPAAGGSAYVISGAPRPWDRAA